jgi:hypothetical protein
VTKNQSKLAHYAQVTTARMTHIMWLTNLAPEIQEAILFLPRVESGYGERDRCAADRSGDAAGDVA